MSATTHITPSGRDGRSRTAGGRIASTLGMGRRLPHHSVLVSVGYEGRTLVEFIGVLNDHKVRTLVDVRLTPLSRKPGFSKSALSNALDAAGIEYRHEPTLGNPKSNRDGYRRGSLSARERYARRLRKGSAFAYQATLDRVRSGGVAIMCFERDHGDCHRSTITDHLHSDDPRIGVVAV